MSKKKIWILAIVMTLVLLGLIFIQGYWINVAIKLKEQQFSYFVNQTLSVVTNELEHKEALSYVIDELKASGNDTTKTEYYYNLSSNPSNKDLLGREESEITEVRVESNSSYIRQELKYNKATKSFYIKDSNQVNVISSDSLKTISKTAQDANAYIKKKMNNKSMIINKVVNEMIKKKPEIEERIDFSTINNLLGRELKKRGININYQFAVSKIGSEPIIKTNNFKVKTKSEVYIRMLFPNDLYSPQTYLTMYFPKERKLFYKSLGIMGVSSIFFTFFLIMTFISTLLIIFRQKKLAQIKTDFVNNMTHEFKTPISTISLASEMMKEKGVKITGDKLKQISGVIEEESKRLGRQVEKVLQIAIFDKGKIKYNFDEININSILSNVASNFEIQVKNKNGRILKELNAKDPVLNADEVHFSNILSSLVDNAIKYCDKEPEITLSSWNSRKRLLVAVKDNGIGISKKEQKKIFEKFYRVSTGNVHNIKGFGLGLCYVKTIVEEHGGTINIDSQPGKGTSFILSFPKKNHAHG